MRRTLIAVVVLAISAVGQVRIKNHALGESVAEFVKNDSEIQSRINDCKNGKHVLSAAEAAEKGQVFESDAAYRDRCGVLGTLQKALQENSPVTFAISTGSSFRDFMSKHSLARIGGDRSAWKVHWSFADGKLIRIGFDSLSSYAEVRDDLASKMGKIPTETSIPYQNGFGARWSNPVAEWTTDEYHAFLTEGHDPVNPTWATLMVERRADYDKQRAAQKDAHPLDNENSSGPNPVRAVPALPENSTKEIIANSEAAKASPAAAASLGNVGHVLSPQELEELVQKGQASKCAVVTIPPGADIEVDGNKLGVSPLAFVLLKRGETPRTITVRKDGYKAVEKKVVPDGKTIPIGLTMEKQ